MSAPRPDITATEIRNGLYNLYSLELAKHLHSCGMITHDQFLEAACDAPNRIGSNALRFAKENKEEKNESDSEAASDESHGYA